MGDKEKDPGVAAAKIATAAAVAAVRGAEDRPTALDEAESPPTKSREEIVLPRSLDSGDIILFNRRCSAMPAYGAAICFVAKFFSNSKWDHVGIVVRDPDKKDLYFFEADLGGVKLRSLSERVNRSKSNDIAVRRLSMVRTDDFRRRLWNFAQEMTGRPYESGTGLLMAAHAVLDPLSNQERERLHALLVEKRAQWEEIEQEMRSAALTAFQRRTLLAERDRVKASIASISQRMNEVIEREPVKFKRQKEADKLARVFCSELVAAAYQRLGLLEAYPAADSYSPKDFSSDPHQHLLLLGRVRLSKEEHMKSNNRVPAPAVSLGAGESSIALHTGEPPQSTNRNVIRKVMKRTPLYNELPDAFKRNSFVSSFRSLVVEPGDIIFQQGEYGDRFYIIESGSVERFISKSDLEPVHVSTLGAHTSFGLSAFTYNIPRSSTIRAAERSLLWTVDRPTYEGFRDQRDVRQILSSAERRQLRTILKDHFLFRRLDRIGPRELDSFFSVHFRAGEDIFQQGDAHDNFYVIKSGEVERHIRRPQASGEESTKLVKTLGPGESFGELGLMYDAPRSATTRARTDVECWAINSESFHRLHLGGGARYLQAVFQKHASMQRDGKLYCTAEDFQRFAKAYAFDEKDRERLSKLLIALVTSNRRRDDHKDGEGVLIDFWEFVRFDIVLNQPYPELEFAFRLADRNNTGLIDMEEMTNLLVEYSDIDEDARKLLQSPSLFAKFFGKDGSRELSLRQFRTLANDNILPPKFVEDVRVISHHMLHELESAGLEEEQEGYQSLNTFDSDVYRSRSRRSPHTGSREAPRTLLDLSHLLAVAIAGAVARTVVSPLERLKILMQTDSIAKRRYTGLFSGTRRMIGDGHALKALFRGNGANVARTIPTAIIQISLVELLRREANHRSGRGTDGAQEGDIKELARDKVAIAGGAGIAAAVATYPLEFIRGRLTVQTAAQEPYRGITNGLRLCVQETGVRSLFRGLTPTVLGVFPYVGVSFAAYETLSSFLPKQRNGTGLPTTASAIIGGTVASLTAQTLSYPLDTCRRRMQVDGFLDFGKQGEVGGVTQLQRLSMRQVFTQLWRAEGLAGLYRGFLPNLVKVMPSSVISFYLYDFFKTRITIERNLWMEHRPEQRTTA